MINPMLWPNGSSDGCRMTNAVIVRASRLSGSTHNGAWNESEWVPSLIGVSLHRDVCALPKLQGDANWLPLGMYILADWIVGAITELTLRTDTTSKALLDIAFASTWSKEVVHLANPKRTSYEDLLTGVGSRLGLELGPPVRWLDSLSRLSHDGKNESVGGLQLLPFLEAIAASDGNNHHGSLLLPLPVHKALQLSPTLAYAGPVMPEDLLRSVAWCEQGALLIDA